MFYKDKKILTLLNTYDHLAHNDQDPFFCIFYEFALKAKCIIYQICYKNHKSVN